MVRVWEAHLAQWSLGLQTIYRLVSNSAEADVDESSFPGPDALRTEQVLKWQLKEWGQIFGMMMVAIERRGDGVTL